MPSLGRIPLAQFQAFAKEAALSAPVRSNLAKAGLAATGVWAVSKVDGRSWREKSRKVRAPLRKISPDVTAGQVLDTL